MNWIMCEFLIYLFCPIRFGVEMIVFFAMHGQVPSLTTDVDMDGEQDIGAS